MRSTRLAVLAALAGLAAVAPASAHAAPDDFCPIAKKVCDHMPWDRYEVSGVYIDGETTAHEETSSHTFDMKGTTAYAAPPNIRGRFETVQKGLATLTAKPVAIEQTSEATYRSGDDVFDCSFDPVDDLLPSGLGAIAVLRGGKVRIQWSFMPAGWGCGGNGPDSPVTPSSGEAPKDLTTTVHPVSIFRGPKVKLKVDLEHTWTNGDMRVTQTWWGDVKLRRVKR